MKDKRLGAFLALFFGWIGGHYWYTNQKIPAMACTLLFFTMIPFILGLWDCVRYWKMDWHDWNERFNRKSIYKD